MRQGTDSQTAAADPERGSRTAGRDRGSSLLCIFNFEEISRKIKQKSQNFLRIDYITCDVRFQQKKNAEKAADTQTVHEGCLTNVEFESRKPNAVQQLCSAAAMRCRSYAAVIGD